MYAKLTKILCASLSLACLVPKAAAASSHGPHLSRHAELAKRADSDVQLFRRVTGSRWTYYNVETGNAGSCGKKHVNTDFTVAMNAAQMNPGWCFKTIRMTQGGKTTTATVTDTCPGCPWGGLDLTEGLFGFFIGHWPVGGGVLSGDWEFTDAAPPPPPPKPTSKPPPPPPVTTNAKPKTTSSIVSHKPTSTSTKISSSTISKTSSSVSSSSTIASTSIDYLSGPASGLAIPTGSIDRTDSSPSNLQDLNQFLIQVGGLAMAAGAL
ncbi:hypothetical protein JR316_0002480 [Psilocybe cubensis]|uniref:RlpA-like double-psi beta-barrel-protein domain-containing protein-containing protein n=2 Tax=Psilocybe cubensis TaxID=181762 RepID=A0A8H7Y814_PSICU|nr:hypothetical protein JR316_0002480 [Psilocybe cubensis]KAH9485570.1 hypothetical protein JR316_0002480 [Psilocybe cubensis]